MANNRKRRKKKNGCLLPLVVILILIGVGAYFALSMFSNDMGMGSESITIEIPQNSTVNDIADILAENGVVDSSAHFKFLCKKNNEGSQFKFGVYTFEPNSDFNAIVNKLNNGDADDNSVHITVKEGMWLSEIAEEVAQSGLCTKEEFMSAANSRDYAYDFVKDIPQRDNLLEGYLYPETYYFYPGNTAHDIVDTMLNQFDKACNEKDVYSKAASKGMSLDDVVIIASLIESEVKVDEERNIVSSVIHNRLAQNMRLQIDASVIYSKGERVTRVYYSDLESNSPYNTYTVDGLPKGPISSPRADSLVAAAEPADTDYLYYVVENQSVGNHYFTADYDDFLTASEKYKSSREQ